MKVLVTGCAGFIGSHVSEFLLKRGDIVIGIDNINNYYDISQKIENLKILEKYSTFTFYKEDIIDTKIINEEKPDKVVHLASMAGVRYSIENPEIYVKVNVQGFINLLEQAVKNNIKNFVYASSSSVYGLNKKIPFNEEDIIETCNSPYAASKRTMEIFAKTYNQLYKIPLIGLRFFTVYGERGRPDMAPFKFLNAIHTGSTFKKFGNGESMRDYTYISDIVSGIISALDNRNNLSCEIFNLGNSNPIKLNTFIDICEKITQKKAIYEEIEDQSGDVPVTFSDISKAKKLLDYHPKVDIVQGLTNTYQWIKKKSLSTTIEYQQ